MSASWLRVPGLMVASSWLVVACSSSAKKIEVGGTCILNSDCTGTLVCTAGKCHDACHTSADCPTGQSCVKTSDSVICQLPAETSCSGALSCSSGLSCAPDQHCRTGCLSVANCTPGQVCASNFCADPTDPDLVNGQLPPTAASDAGTYDASSPDLSLASPADVPVAAAGPEAGVTHDALDASAGPDAPVAPRDVAAPDLALASPPDVSVAAAGPEAGMTRDALDASAGPDVPAPPLDVAAPDLAPDVAVSPPDATEVGLACANGCNDNLSCTTDSCVAGVCQNTLNPSYCLIDKACYMDGDTDPNDACQACTITTSTSLWTVEPEGAPCGTGRSCQSHACTPCGNVGQACCGTATPGTCVVGAACNASTNQCQADKAVDISGSNDTFCALFQSGRVRCWGSSGPNLGIGTNTGSNVAAAPVAGLTDAVQISVGYSGVCAVRATGAVVCWGYPPGGATATTTVVVPGITNARQVSLGVSHACVRTANSKVLCWGGNGFGQFGDGTRNSNSTPTEMLNVADARMIATAGQSTCVLRTSGQVSCTGQAHENGQTTDVSSVSDLVAVTDASTLTGVHADPWDGWYCSIGGTGALLCWGEDPQKGYQQPSAAVGVGQALAAASDSESYWVIQQDRSLWALGNNSYGQLGDGTSTDATAHVSPQLAHVITPLGGVVAVAVATSGTDDAGRYHSTSCLLRDDGSLSCAGWAAVSNYSVLGDGQAQPAANRTPFVPVVGILPVASEAGQCYDGVDNDGNGKTDLDDPACAQNLGSAVGSSVATVPFTGIFGNYLQESCNVKANNANYGGPEAVLTWTAPSGGTFQFDTTGSSFDTVLAAYKGNPLTAAELACNDDGAGLTGGASLIKVQVITGDKLTLVVDSKSAPTGPASFNLNITKQ